MSPEELSLKAEIVVKVLDDFGKTLAGAIIDRTFTEAQQEKYRAIRRRMYAVRDELRDEVVG